MMFEPGENFEPGGKQKSVIDFAKSRLKGAGAAIAFTVFATLISSLIGIINPAFSRIFLDRLLTHENPDWFVPFIVMLSVMTGVQLLVALIQASMSLKINGKMEIYGSSSYMWKVLRMPMEFFSQRMAGDIQQRQFTNANIANTLVNTFAPLVLQAIMMIFYLVVMLRYRARLQRIGR